MNIILVEHHLCCKPPEWKHFYSMGKCPKYQNTPSLQLFTGKNWTAKPNVCRMIKKKKKNYLCFDMNWVSFLKTPFFLSGQRLTKSWHFQLFFSLLNLCFVWVNIQSNSSIIISITIFNALRPPVLRSSPLLLTSLFIGLCAPFHHSCR